MLEWRYDALHEQKWRYYDYDFFSLSLAPRCNQRKRKRANTSSEIREYSAHASHRRGRKHTKTKTIVASHITHIARPS